MNPPDDAAQLTVGASQLLVALDRAADGSSARPGALVWLRALLEIRADLVEQVSVGAPAPTLQDVDRRLAGGEAGPPLGRGSLVVRVGEKARASGRPVVPADLAAVILELSESSAASEPVPSGPTAPALPIEPAPGPGQPAEVGAGDAALRPSGWGSPASLSLGAAASLSTLEEEAASAGDAGVYRWLVVALARHGEETRKQLLERGRDLEMWARARLAASDVGPVLDRGRIADRAARLAADDGRAVANVSDVIRSIVELVVETLEPMGAGAAAAAPDEVEGAEPRQEPEPAPESREPEAALESEEPEAALQSEEPKAALQSEEPEAALESGQPGVGTPSVVRAGRTRAFRLFVSSTFRDFPVERNLLQRDVFPDLQRYCVARNARFQAIDLRWGVSEEAGLDQRTMEICLDEIDRCHRVTPRPNFLLLLGDSYGWCPPPPRVPASELEGALETVGDRHRCRDLLLDWYRRDENAVPPEYRLRPRRLAVADDASAAERRATREAEAKRWQFRIEPRLHRLLAAATAGLGLEPERCRAYVASATEQEVAAGAFRLNDPTDRVFCVFRRIHPRPTDEEGNPTTAAARTYIDAQRDSRLRLRALKGEIQEYLDEAVGQAAYRQKFDAQVGWSGGGPTDDSEGGEPALDEEYQARFAAWVRASLQAAIDRELAEPTGRPGVTLDPVLLAHLDADPQLQDEAREHLEFAAERRRHFVGRTGPLAAIADYLEDGVDQAFCLVGGGGTGKSAVLARALESLREARPGAAVVARFIGATPGSSDGRTLLDGLCREISRCYGADVEDLPSDYRELVPELGRRMELASEDRPLVLVLDSLDQLADRDGARALAWIPARLPEHVRMVLSTRPMDTFTALRRLEPVTAELGPMTRDEAGWLLDTWLTAVHPSRTLQPPQRKAVLDAFERSEGRPLYLKLAVEEARRWPAWATDDGGTDAADGAVVDAPVGPLAIGIDGLIRDNLFPRLADTDSHGPVLVSRALGYLAASRYGLAEDEMIALLSRDPEVYGWFLAGAFHMPQDLADGAAAYWRRCRQDSGRERPVAGGAVTRWLRRLARDPDRVEALLAEPELTGLRLPVVLWSRLSLDLQPYLAERLAEGAALLDFYHRELGDAARTRYLPDCAPDLHARLADYFRARVDPDGDGTWTGDDVRGLSELPYHLTEACRWDELHDVLTDFRFLERKAAEVGVVRREGEGGDGAHPAGRPLYTGVFQLQEDYDHALDAMGAGDGAEAGGRRRIILTAVDLGDGYVIHCPHCSTRVPFEEEWLGEERSCPVEGCAGPWKVNPFVVKRPEKA